MNICNKFLKVGSADIVAAFADHSIAPAWTKSLRSPKDCKARQDREGEAE
jgi:hypothetical protein